MSAPEGPKGPDSISVLEIDVSLGDEVFVCWQARGEPEECDEGPVTVIEQIAFEITGATGIRTILPIFVTRIENKTTGKSADA